MKRKPILHITDLYHPPQDPDDQLDLAALVALEFDLKGVIIDVTRRFLTPQPEGFDIGRDPGFVLITQLGYLLGRSIPAAISPMEPLRDVRDDARDRPRVEQAGIQLLLEVLETSGEPVVISIVGSARVLAAAFNRAPELVRAKVDSVLLNAGSTGGTGREWNVQLDPSAYIRLWQSGLPIHWYPCATDTGAFNPAHARGTFWKAPHAALFDELPPSLRAWFAYGFGGSSRGDIIRSLNEMGKGAVWEHVLAGSRNLWSTASLVMAAGRVLAKLPEGWRFVTQEQSAKAESIWDWRLDPITATVTEEADVHWRLADASAKARLFGRQEGVEYGEAMAQALNALLKTIPL